MALDLPSRRMLGIALKNKVLGNEVADLLNTAAPISGVVDLSSNQTIGGVKTFTATVAGTTTGNVGTQFTNRTSVTVSNTTTATSLVPAGVGSASTGANRLAAGTNVRVQARGFYSTAVASSIGGGAIAGSAISEAPLSAAAADAAGGPSLRWQVKLGSTTVLDTGLWSPTGGIANQFWQLTADLTCYTTGVAGTLFAEGDVQRQEQAGSSPLLCAMVNTSTTTINTTSSQLVDVAFSWGTAKSANSITCSNLSIELLN